MHLERLEVLMLKARVDGEGVLREGIKRDRKGSTVELTGDQHAANSPGIVHVEIGVPIIGLHHSLMEEPLLQGSSRVGIKEAAGLLVKAADVVKLSKVGRR